MSLRGCAAGDHQDRPGAPPSFPYRAWSICCVTPTRALFECHFSRALAEAWKYHVNRIELHDYYIPWVNFGIAYRDYPKLSRLSQLGTGYFAPTDVDFGTAKAYMKEVFGRVKGAGLKLNVWYHIGRDVPPELVREYPQYADVDTGFVYEFEENCLREFLELYPEVDGLTVTSLHETDSILSRPGSSSRRERLSRLYGAIHSVCKRMGRELILRDFIIQRSDYEDFLAALEELPKDIIIMTKNVLADWAFVHQAQNPFLVRYAGRRLVVEFDLYGEFQGRTDLPYTDPEYYYQRLRELLPFGAEGAVGRIVHDEVRASQFPTIFDSLNEVNVAAFSRTLYDPGATLETQGEWVPELESDPGLKVWLPWARERFGEAASPWVVPLLRQCPALVAEITAICGFLGQFNTTMLAPDSMARDGWYRQWVERVYPAGVLERWIQQDPLALAMIEAEKEDLVTRAQSLWERGKRLAQAAPSQQTEALVAALENLHLVARAARVVALVYAAVIAGGEPASRLRTLCQEAQQLADEIVRRRGDAFYLDLPQILRDWAAWGAGASP